MTYPERVCAALGWSATAAACIAIAVTFASLAQVPPANASVPFELPFQGVILDAAGQPAPDGLYSMTFRLYATSADTDALWSETWDADGAGCGSAPAHCVAVVGGGFDVRLGTVSELPATLASSGVARWLGISVEADPELPRQALGSAAFSWRAAVAESAEELACSGCVGIGHLAASTLDQLSQNAVEAVAAAGFLAGGLPVPASALPSDGLAAVSNGVLTNTIDATVDAANLPVPLDISTSTEFSVGESGTITAAKLELTAGHPYPPDLQVLLFPPPPLAPVELAPTGALAPDESNWSWSSSAGGGLEGLLGLNATGIWTLSVVDAVTNGNEGVGSLEAATLELTLLSDGDVGLVQANGTTTSLQGLAAAVTQGPPLVRSATSSVTLAPGAWHEVVHDLGSEFVSVDLWFQIADGSWELWSARDGGVCVGCSTGIGGGWEPATSGTLASGEYEFTTVTIPEGVVVTVQGEQPLIIRASGTVRVDGSLVLDGSPGTIQQQVWGVGTGGAAGPGGYGGGWAKMGPGGSTLPFLRWKEDE